MPNAISEADDGSGGKPFDVNGRDAARAAAPAPAAVMPPAAIPSGVPEAQPGQPSAAAMDALGLTPPAKAPNPAKAPPAPNPLFKAAGVQPPAPLQDPTPPAVTPGHIDPAAQAIVENYSATIQRHAEEAYATALYRAKQDPTVLEAMVASGDKVERNIAEKLLQRNPELFGAGTIEEYQAKTELARAGDDPRDREIAQLKMDNAKRDAREQDREWRDWKKEHGVKDDAFGQLCDQARKEYPSAPKGDIVAIARGRAGIKSLEPTALDGIQVPSTGGRGAPQDAGSQINQGAASMLGLGGTEVSQAEAYFESIGGVTGRR